MKKSYWLFLTMFSLYIKEKFTFVCTFQTVRPYMHLLFNELRYYSRSFTELFLTVSGPKPRLGFETLARPKTTQVNDLIKKFTHNLQ